MKIKGLGIVIAFITLAISPSIADKAVKCNIKTLTQCPRVGCAKPGTPLATTNTLKRTTAINGSPAKLTFEDFQRLQDDVDEKFVNGPITIKGAKVTSYHSLKAAPRKIILSGLKAKSATFSEGDFVELVGFIAATKLPPHPNTGESVNCKLKEEASNDYHINVTPAKNDDETDGVVVEMIPQDPNRRDKDWNLVKLRAIQDQQLQVKVHGRLFFDSEHKPNTNKTGSAGGNPRRFSLWEIHPVTSFFVCPSAKCSGTADWIALEKWTPKE